jgi:hypothetical protein
MEGPHKLGKMMITTKTAPLKGMAYYDSGKAGNKFRLDRLRRFLLPLLEKVAAHRSKTRILDIGGNVQYWEPIEQDLQQFKCEVTLLNVTGSALHESRGGGRFSFVIGDGRDCKFPDDSFDLVHSNSVIEHVGNWKDMQAMAKEVRRLAPAYYLQVPYFWFPLEPHFRTPFFHWLPEQVRSRMIMRRSLGFMNQALTMAQAVEAVQSAQLLDVAQVKALFPDAAIVRERALFLTKSVIALRQGRAAI